MMQHSPGEDDLSEGEQGQDQQQEELELFPSTTTTRMRRPPPPPAASSLTSTISSHSTVTPPPRSSSLPMFSSSSPHQRFSDSNATSTTSASSSCCCSPTDAIPDIIETSSSSEKYFETSCAAALVFSKENEDDYYSEDDPLHHPYLHVPPPPVPSPCVKSVRSKRRSRRSVVERRRSSKQQHRDEQRSLILLQQQKEHPQPHYNHPPRLRRSSSTSIRTSLRKHKKPKDLFTPSSPYCWCPTRTILVRMLGLVGMLSVSLTFVAYRSMLNMISMSGSSTTSSSSGRNYYDHAAIFPIPHRLPHGGSTATSAAGLRGKILNSLLGGKDGSTAREQQQPGSKTKLVGKGDRKLATSPAAMGAGRSASRQSLSPVILPKGKLVERKFEAQDRNLYTHNKVLSTSSSSSSNHRQRVVVLHDSILQQHHSASSSNKQSHYGYRRKLQLYPHDFTDPTQLYGVLDSSDERVKVMELRPPLVQGECVPMREWQTTFSPSCNGMHEMFDLSHLGEEEPKTSTTTTKKKQPPQPGREIRLFGTKGYWRHAWKVDVAGPDRHSFDTVVLKTLKIEHRFEEKHFEHNRIDAVAMERLTSSPHVINIFGFCGNSVITEYADGKRLGELADKSKTQPLARLRIAVDIASGLADVHGIDGDDNATFVHLDINPANVVSIGRTLKLNDFNIGIIRRWNTTSNTPCGFPAQYPNPQWRSPEEARGESNLTEKVDIFSMGHIFFRMICGHEPWNKLESGGKPSKNQINEKVEKGVLPTIPKEILRSKDPEEVAIREAMLKCYTFDPQKRPSAREIASLLQKALDHLEAPLSKKKQTASR